MKKFESFTIILNASYIVRDHRVHGVRILPGVTLLDLVYRLAKEHLGYTKLTLENILFQTPIATSESFDQEVRIDFNQKNETMWNVTIASQKIEKKKVRDNYWQPVATCILRTDVRPEQEKTLDVKWFQRHAEQRWDMDEVYELARKMEITHREFMKTLGTIYKKGEEELMVLHLSELAEKFREKFIAHPAFLDGATFAGNSFQLSKKKAGLFQDDVPYIPFTIKHFAIYSSFPATICVYTQVTNPINEGRIPDLIERDIEVYDAQGKCIAEFQALNAKRIRAPNLIKQLVGINGSRVVKSKNTNIKENSTPRTFKKQGKHTGLQEAIITYIKDQVAEKLGKDREEISNDVGFYDLGLDSTQLLDMTKTLENVCGHDFYPTLLFEYKTIVEISAYLRIHDEEAFQSFLLDGKDGEVEKEEEAYEIDNPPEISPHELLRDRTPCREPLPNDEIAIIGLAGRYPEASDLSEFWDHIKTGKNCIREIPKDHWSVAGRYTDAQLFNHKRPLSVSKWGGFIKDADKFDPFFFNISPREAEAIDPQLRLLLETAWHTLEDAAYPRSSCQNETVGVYVGVMNDDYTWVAAEHLERTGIYGSPGSYAHELANRLSHFLNLRGPSLTIETACSSSLTAIHLARRAIQNGECNIALAGGVNISAHRSKYLMLSQLGILSPDGKERTFDRDANGYVPGEGVGLVLLKPLRDALTDKDHIYGVIKGSAINHSGHGPGKYVPSLQALAEVVEIALIEANIQAEQIGYIETHGTGTLLGDPIEIQALSKVFQNGEHKVALGSKANVGHLESASGICSLTKVLLAMQEHTIPPCANVEEPNPGLGLSQTPFYLPKTAQAWNTPAEKKIAVILSFGVGGSNGCMLIQGVNRPRSSKRVAKKTIAILLSARTQMALRQSAKNLNRYLVTTKDVDIEELAYTLQVGREAMKYRLAVVVRNVATLQKKLKTYLISEEKARVFTGKLDRWNNLQSLFNGKNGREFIKNLIVQKEWEKLAAIWAQGFEIDWKACYGNQGKRISLPKYPFAKERYWLEERDEGVRLKAGGCARLHPLVHENTSNFEEQRFSSTFMGDEFFLTHHVVQGQKVLPGVAYLEMARAAVEQTISTLSTGSGQAVGSLADDPTEIQLKNVVWAGPLVVKGDAIEVQIGLFPEEHGQIHYEIYTDGENGKDELIVHSQGKATFKTFKNLPNLDFHDLRASMDQGRHSSKQCYEVFKGFGIDYGNGNQGLELAYMGENEVLAKLSLPSSVLETQDQYVLHPSIMASALQAWKGLFLHSSELGINNHKLLLPISLDELEITGACTASMWAWVRSSEGTVPGEKLHKLNIDLCDDKGQLCVRMKQFSSRVIEEAARSADSVGTLMFYPIWKEEAVPVAANLTEYSNRVVMLCEMDLMDIRSNGITPPPSDCAWIRLHSKEKDIAKHYQDISIQVFETIKEILENRPKDEILIQILIPSQGEQRLFRGLSGLLKTAHLENPKIFGQVIEVDPNENEERLLAKVYENSGCPGDLHIRYRDNRRQLLSWKEAGPSVSAARTPWKDGGGVSYYRRYRWARDDFCQRNRQ